MAQKGHIGYINPYPEHTRQHLELLVRWSRKDTSKLHDFDWEVSLLVPTPRGRRSMCVSASQAKGYHRIWFAGLLEILRRFQQVVFR